MLNLPEIKKKKPKASYLKSEAVKELERMADAEAKKLHPSCPYLATRKFKDNSANSLTGCIVKYITLKGGFATRINSTGIYDIRLNRYRPGTQKKGISDIISMYRGKSLSIEVKYGKDVQSEAQKKIEAEIIRAGGLYYEARNFSDFKDWFDRI
jgi:Holliday junction resolvase